MSFLRMTSRRTRCEGWLERYGGAMRKAVLTLAVFLAVPAAGAFAQDDMERRAAELKKWYENARREAEEQFRGTMQKLERAFAEKLDAIKREGAEKRDV